MTEQICIMTIISCVLITNSHILCWLCNQIRIQDREIQTSMINPIRPGPFLTTPGGGGGGISHLLTKFFYYLSAYFGPRTYLGKVKSLVRFYIWEQNCYITVQVPQTLRSHTQRTTFEKEQPLSGRKVNTPERE